MSRKDLPKKNGKSVLAMKRRSHLDKKVDDRFRFLEKHLRKAHRFWPPRLEALKRACIGKGLYCCEHCNKLLPRKIPKVDLQGKPRLSKSGNQLWEWMIQVDHVDPVAPLDGSGSLDEKIMRMFCDADGYQVLCSACHYAKTQKENAERRSNPAASPPLSLCNRQGTDEALCFLVPGDPLSPHTLRHLLEDSERTKD